MASLGPTPTGSLVTERLTESIEQHYELCNMVREGFALGLGE